MYLEVNLLQADWPSLIVTVLLSASPIGEILLAIPAGVAFEMNPFFAFIVAYPANLVPALIILQTLGYLEKKIPRVFNFFARRGVRYRRQLTGKYGLTVLLLITPLIVVYATSVSSILLGFEKQSFVLQSISLVSYGIIETIGLSIGIQLIPALMH
jgi:hypothetical protein